MGFHTYVMEGVSKAPNPKVSFLVGALLVMFIVLVLTTVFLCLYHWSKLVKEYREQRMMASAATANASSNNAAEEGDQKIVILLETMPCEVPLVYMPGYAMPTFVAMPSPYDVHPNFASQPISTVPPLTSHDDKVELTSS